MDTQTLLYPKNEIAFSNKKETTDNHCYVNKSQNNYTE